MLVLTRKMNEEILIGDPAQPLAKIFVIAVFGDKVRLGITASKAIPVHRSEVAQAIVTAGSSGAAS